MSGPEIDRLTWWSPVGSVEMQGRFRRCLGRIWWWWCVKYTDRSVQFSWLLLPPGGGRWWRGWAERSTEGRKTGPGRNWRIFQDVLDWSKLNWICNRNEDFYVTADTTGSNTMKFEIPEYLHLNSSNWIWYLFKLKERRISTAKQLHCKLMFGYFFWVAFRLELILPSKPKFLLNIRIKLNCECWLSGAHAT